MSNFSSYIINFYVTVSGTSPVANVITYPSVPTSTSVNNSITEITNYLKENDITLSNYSLVKTSVEDMINKVKTTVPSSTSLDTTLEETQASVNDKEMLMKNLTSLSKMVQGSTGSSEFVKPEQDTQSAPPASVITNVKNKRPQNVTNVIKFKSLATKVSSVETNSTQTSATLNSFIEKVKTSMTKYAETGATTTTATPNTVYNAITTTLATGANPNLFNNLTAMVLGTSRTRTKPKTTTKAQVPFTEITSFTGSAPTTMESTKPTVTSVTNSYEISTSQNGDFLNVTFSYFPAGAEVSSFACNFNLTKASLFSVSKSAFNSASKSTLMVKNKLMAQAGYTAASFNPTPQDIWTSYLIFLFSYLSFGVASQLGANITVPSSSDTSSSANYMLSKDYLNNMGNVSLPIQTSVMDSDKAALVSTGIPGEWSDLMYSESGEPKTYNSSKTLADSIIYAMKMQNSESIN